MLKLERIYKFGTAFEILAEAILYGDIEPGTEITQTEAASSLGVSRMPVREAFLALEYCGLVERLPGQHVRVSDIDGEDVKNIFGDFAALSMGTVRKLDPDGCEDQAVFLRMLENMTKSSLRKKFLEIIIEVYLMPVIKNPLRPVKINEAFSSLLNAMKNSDTAETERCFEVYCGVLADELIKIRMERKIKNVKSQTG